MSVSTAILRSFPSLKDFNDADLSTLISVARERPFAPAAWVCQEGQPGASCFLLISGALDVIKASPEGARLLATMQPGALVGQVALVDKQPRSASMRAKGPTVVLELARDDFERLLKANSPLALKFQEQIAVAGIKQLRTGLEKLGALLKKPEKRAAAEYVKTAMTEWSISLEQELEQMEVIRPDGQMSQAELSARRR
jgi:CRP-like cAMP-binding protein